MTTKERFIVHLRQARVQHQRWLNEIKLMVMGISADRERVALNPSESPFGMWLYDEAMVFAVSSSKNVLEEIASFHGECHDHYFKIYHTLYGKSGGFLQGMLGARKPGASELMLAQKFYEELVPVSDNLLNRLRVFESQMLATVETKFDELLFALEAPEEEAPAAPVSKKVQRMYRGQPVE
jgi:hypothetical protein